MTVTAATSELGKTSEPADIVRTFLLALEAGKLDEALALLADDVEYTNVSLPTVRGRAGVERLVRPALEKLHLGFRLHCHTIATNGHTVLTERTDALILGRIEQRIWVYGRFDVVDGRITLWRDSFDWLDMLVGLVRGLAGALIPAFNRRWPGDSWETTARSSPRRRAARSRRGTPRRHAGAG
jgi:limonene-1,2-epoxide hydrolase